MKRILILLLAAALALALAGCGGAPDASKAEAAPAAAEPTPETAPEPTPEPVAMTDAYREGRQAYYDITGIWLPEAADLEAEYEVNADDGSICFDTRGDREFFEAARAALRQALGEPSYEDDARTSYSISDGDGPARVYEIIYHDADPAEIWVFLNVYNSL